MRIPPLVFALLVLGAGCESSRRSERYPTEERRAERAVAEAKEQGADKHSTEGLEGARKAIDEARSSEAAAIKDEKGARERLANADKRGLEVDRRLAARRSELKGAEAVRDDHQAALDRLLERRDDLLSKGETREDLRTTLDPDVDLARARVKASDAVVATLAQQVALGELEQKSNDFEKESARAGLETAQTRMDVARSLYDRAKDQAKLARAESLQVQRAELRMKP